MNTNIFHINPSDPTPIHAQLARAIQLAITTEMLKVGDQLPTVRQLAVDLKINANTVAKVYLELERIGVVETRRGVGTFVRGAALITNLRAENDKQLLRTITDRFMAEVVALGWKPSEILELLIKWYLPK